MSNLLMLDFFLKCLDRTGEYFHVRTIQYSIQFQGIYLTAPPPNQKIDINMMIDMKNLIEQTFQFHVNNIGGTSN